MNQRSSKSKATLIVPKKQDGINRVFTKNDFVLPVVEGMFEQGPQSIFAIITGTRVAKIALTSD